MLLLCCWSFLGGIVEGFFRKDGKGEVVPSGNLGESNVEDEENGLVVGGDTKSLNEEDVRVQRASRSAVMPAVQPSFGSN